MRPHVYHCQAGNDFPCDCPDIRVERGWQGAKCLKAPEERPISDRDIRADGFAEGFRQGWREACDYLAEHPELLGGTAVS